MRILIIHNHYQSSGGEDAVFEQEKSLLSTTEVVASLTFQNRKSWKGAWQTLWSPWNIWAGRRVKKAIQAHRPDVIHIHNLHYAIGPIAIRVAKRQGIPVVMTLHNYRLLCPSATLFHQGKPFTDSIHVRFPWKAIRLGVHAGSMAKTFWLAFTVWLHKKIGTWQMVDRYIALTDFAKRLFLDSTFGVPANQFTVKPNFVTEPNLRPMKRQPHFLFIGRLTEEKGIAVLLEAFMDSNLLLRIAGDGPLKGAVVNASKKYTNITYLGRLDRAAIGAQLAECSALIFPSIWYEGMPMTIIEAFAAGTPMIASDIGAMPSMVAEGRSGYLFPAGNASALRKKIQQWFHTDEAAKAQLGSIARQEYERRYTPEKNKTLLLGIYAAVIQR
ncbi:glycosyltransferase [Parapedobacter tibetensis]|uniref:glycosyltransferase n=1 Tax=Parapedobacter tibetensis TaxID=2972951 RepID=UPI00214DA33F|nr:glycosyltransferase [Parapedobacter tibetensis]